MTSPGPNNYLGRFVILFGGRIGGALAIFLVNILIARTLGIEALGKYAVFASLVAILTICLPFGYTAIASVFVAKYLATDRLDLLKGYVRSALRSIAVSASLLIIALLAVYYFLPHYMANKNVGFGLLVILTAIATSLLNLNGAVMVGLKRQVAGLLPETAIRPFLMLCGVFALFFINNSVGIISIMAIAAGASWIALLMAFWGAKELRRIFKENRTALDPRQWKKAAYPWLATSLLWDYMIDIILLLTSLLTGAAEIAVLHICFRYRVLAGFGMRSIYMLLMPEITVHTISGNVAELDRKISQANIASLVYSVGAIGAFAVFGDWLVGLFSAEIKQAVPILIIVSLTMVTRAIFGPATLILAVRNLHIATAFVSFVGLILVAAIIALFFTEFGLLAVAIGYSFSNLLVSISLWRYAKAKTGIDSSIFAVRMATVQIRALSDQKSLPN